MNWLDIAIGIVMAITALIGLWVGLIRAVFSLAGIVVGVILAGRYYATVAGWLSFISQPSVAKAIAFILILLAVVVIAFLLANLLKWAMSVMMLGWVNRVGGAVLGLFLAATACGALLAMWVKFFGISGAVSGSFLARFLLDYFPLVLKLLPKEFDVVRSFFQ